MKMEPTHRYKDLEKYLEHLRPQLADELVKIMADKGGVNFWLNVRLKYKHPTKEESEKDTYLHTAKLVIPHVSKLEEKLDDVEGIIHLRNVTYNRNTSGLVIDRIYETNFKVIDYIPM